MTQLPEVHRTGGLIGAEIRGLDLTREYPDEAGSGHGMRRVMNRIVLAGAKPVPAA